MKKNAGIICILLMMGIFLQSQTLKTKPVEKRLTLVGKIWVKVLCMNKWDDGNVTNTAMVVVKERNQSGPVINNARVEVNGRLLTYNAGISEYKGNIGNITTGQKVPFVINTKDGRKVTGYVEASYFVIITTPKPLAQFSLLDPIPVKWKFSNNRTYLVVFKILQGESELFSTDVNGSSYIIRQRGSGLKRPLSNVIRARVISPWTDRYHFDGAFAAGSKGQFFTSATISIRIKK
jgi:hypothetical protein